MLPVTGSQANLASATFPWWQNERSMKTIHEIRDPVHVFVRLDDHEREVLNSRPFQRLRHIHQLALTYLVDPGASHKRFEHSLGVMELATSIPSVGFTTSI
jgi:hypothetical protein